MRKLFLFVVLCFAVPMVCGADGPDGSSVNFARDIAPILQQKCVACHRDKQSEGGLSLETTEAMLRGGDSGASIVAGNLDDSVLFARVSGAEEPIMPPEDNAIGAKPVTAEELERIRRWITGGAKLEPMQQSESLEAQPIPETIKDSFALAVSPDGNLLAVAQANRVDLLDAATGQRIGRLVDDSLQQNGAADIDFIQAIEFSPLGDRIATGGFRTVRIWKRRPQTPPNSVGLQTAAGLIAVNPDGDRVAMVNAIGDTEVRDMKTGDLITTIGRLGLPVALAWDCPSTMVIADDGGTLRWVNPQDGMVRNETSMDCSITGVCQTSDGRHTAVLGADRRVRVFESAAAVELESVSKIDSASAVAFVSSDSIAVATADGAIQVIQISSAKVQQTLQHGAAVTAIAATADGTKLVTAGVHGDAKLWQLADGKQLTRFVGDPQSNLLLAALDNDIRRESGWIDRLNSETTRLQESLKKEDEALTKVVQAKRDAAKDAKNKQEQLMDVVAQVRTAEGFIDEKTQQIDQAEHVIAAADKTIAASNQAIETLKMQLQPIEQKARTAAAEVTAAEERLADAMKQLQTAKQRVAEINQQVDEKRQALTNEQARGAEAVKTKQNAEQIIKTNSTLIENEKKTLTKLNQSAVTLKETASKASEELRQREQALATAQKTRDLAAAKLPAHRQTLQHRSNRLAGTKSKRDRLASLRESGMPASAVAFSPDVQHVAVVRSDGETVVYHAASGRALAHRTPTDLLGAARTRGARFLDESRLLVHDADHAPVVLSTADEWALDRTIGGMNSDLIVDRVTALDWSADGKVLAIGSGIPSRSGQVLIVDSNDGRTLRRYDDLHSDTLLCLRFSPGDQALATAASDKTIRLIDLQTDRVIGALDGHTHHVLAITWNDDATMIASASADGTIKTWDATTGQRQRTMVNIADEITAIEFVPGTSRVVSAAADGTVRIHDAAKGNQVAAANVPDDALFTAELSPNGSRVYASGQTGTVHVFLMDGLKRKDAWGTSTR